MKGAWAYLSLMALAAFPSAVWTQAAIVQNLPPTWSYVGQDDNGQTARTIPPGTTWRYGAPSCVASNGANYSNIWLYFTNKSSSPITFNAGIPQFGGDPAPGCGKSYYSQDPFVMQPVTMFQNCPTNCIMFLSSTEPNAAVRILSGGEYVESLRAWEQQSLYAAYTALANAQAANASAAATAQLQAAIKSQSDTIAISHGSLDTTTYTILDTHFIHVVNGAPLNMIAP